MLDQGPVGYIAVSGFARSRWSDHLFSDPMHGKLVLQPHPPCHSLQSELHAFKNFSELSELHAFKMQDMQVGKASKHSKHKYRWNQQRTKKNRCSRKAVSHASQEPPSSLGHLSNLSNAVQFQTRASQCQTAKLCEHLRVWKSLKESERVWKSLKHWRSWQDMTAAWQAQHKPMLCQCCANVCEEALISYIKMREERPKLH